MWNSIWLETKHGFYVDLMAPPYVWRLLICLKIDVMLALHL